MKKRKPMDEQGLFQQGQRELERIRSDYREKKEKKPKPKAKTKPK